MERDVVPVVLSELKLRPPKQRGAQEPVVVVFGGSLRVGRQAGFHTKESRTRDDARLNSEQAGATSGFRFRCSAAVFSAAR